MYIVRKKINGNEYYYLRESKREEGRIKAVNVAYLGKDRNEAERKARLILMEKKDLKKGVSRKEDMVEKKEISINDLAIFCKRKGFVYPSGEIYGGLSGFWDYGHLGTALKNNIKNEWRKFFVQKREDIIEIDGAIVTNPKVWKASGHVDSFVDVAVYNKKTKEKFKVDKHEVKDYEGKDEFEIKGEFNPMFTTQVGPVRDDSTQAYMRPETAQLIFADFKAVWDNARMRLPAGIAQIGKAFRNEISPREFIFRNREFEQMEIEYFIKEGMVCPYMDEIKGIEVQIYDENMQKEGKGVGERMEILQAHKKGLIKTDWHAYFLAKFYSWFVSLGANPDKFRARQHVSDEKSHYSSDTWDLEFEFPMGWRELQGFANRTDYDLRQHEKLSNKSMEIIDPVEGRCVPHVVCEPSLGVERAFIVFMLSAYEENEERQNTILKLNPKLAPIKAAVFPIVKSEGYEKIAKDILEDLSEEWSVIYDRSGSIGKRYARNDENGTPYCITVDEKSGEDKSVTIRDRDSTKQIRVKISDLKNVMRDLIGGKSFLECGTLVE